MIKILVQNEISTVKKKKKIERELLVYDHVHKKMIKLNGGKLAFEYGKDEELGTYRLMPKAEDVYEIKSVTEMNKDSVTTWFDIYANYNETTATVDEKLDNGTVFNVDKDEIDKFTYSLERQNMRFKIL